MSSLEKLKTLDYKTGEIFKKLKSVPKNKLIISNNGWSVLEILYHVWLAETSSEKYIRTKIQYPETIIKTPLLSYLRAFLTKYFLLLGFTVKAPKVTAEFPEKINLEELQKNWKKSRSSFSNLIKELDQKNLDKLAIFRHPLMGRINLVQTLYFFELHQNHHLKQIEKKLTILS